VDFPITDVLQMMGRAGRPQYDKHGVAVIMVAEPKKSFYKKFLCVPCFLHVCLSCRTSWHGCCGKVPNICLLLGWPCIMVDDSKKSFYNMIL